MPDASFDRLTSARLVLRRFHPEDLDRFVAYRSDPSVARYQSWENFTRADGVQFIDEMAALHPDMPDQWFQIAIELKATGEMIGDCAVHTLTDAPYEAEIGFTLVPKFQGHGYATEAIECLLAYLFGARQKHRVLALTDTRNTQSIAVLERLGFQPDAAHREPIWFKNEFCQERLYILEREAWHR